MYQIIYNPLSSNGKYLKHINKLKKILNKRKEEYNIVDILLLKNKELEFLKTLASDEKIVIMGGDGTIHYMLNIIKDANLNQRIYYYASGRGNDFSRGHKGVFFEITDEIKNLPRIYFNDTNYTFINGVGMGIDSYVCLLMEEYRKKNIKTSYFKVALSSFKKFRPFSLTLKVDGVEYNFKNVWFFVCMNGKYIGGGMKIAPHARRDDGILDIYVVNFKSIGKLIRRFPFIFIGKHIWFKKHGITEIFGKEIEGKVSGYNILQRDGEISKDIESFYIK